MKSSATVLLSIVGIAVLAGLWAMSGYNGLVTAKTEVETQWAQVETQYQRRFDLIPNLANTVKGAADFEQSTFTAVTAARSQWQQAGESGDLGAQIQAAQGFDSALSRLLVTVESYPQLKATEAFRDFLAQLEGTENRISVARMDFNTAVQGYNLRVKRFPGTILAGIFGYAELPFFEASEGSDAAPEVQF